MGHKYVKDAHRLIHLSLPSHGRPYLQSNPLPAAGLCADNPARRRKHIHVGLTKTSMFWILAGSSAPEIYVSSIEYFIWLKVKVINASKAQFKTSKLRALKHFISRTRELCMDTKLAFVRPRSLFGIPAIVTFVNPFTSEPSEALGLFDNGRSRLLMRLKAGSFPIENYALFSIFRLGR